MRKFLDRRHDPAYREITNDGATVNAKQLAAEIRDVPTSMLSPIAASLRCEQYRTFAELWFMSLGVTDTRETRLVVADALLDELARRTK